MLVSATESINYCHDKAKNKHWEQVIKQHKGDKMLQTLYALRRGLCTMIDEGKIGLDDAIDLFEEHRNRMLPSSDPEEAGILL